MPESGTIVVMEDVDQADYVQPNAIVAMLLKNLGRVYRMFLANGCNITNSTKPALAPALAAQAATTSAVVTAVVAASVAGSVAGLTYT